MHMGCAWVVHGLECAPRPGQVVGGLLCRVGFFGVGRPMTKNRSYSIAFKRQVAEEYLAGAAPSALGRRHDLCRNLVRIWVRKYEAGEYDDDARAADTA